MAVWICRYVSVLGTYSAFADVVLKHLAIITVPLAGKLLQMEG